MSRTLFSTSVKSAKSFARASAASTAFWAACSNKTKNSLFLGRSDRRTGVLLWRHMLPYPGRTREFHHSGRVDRAGGRRRRPAFASVGQREERQQSVTTVVTVRGAPAAVGPVSER